MSWASTTAWIGTLASALAIAAAVWAATLGLLLWRGRSPLIEAALRRGRRRALKPVLVRLGVARHLVERAIRRSSRSAIASPRESSVQEELEWLEDLVRQTGSPVQPPLVVHGLTRDVMPQQQLHDLATAYAMFATRLRSLAVLATNPILEEHADLARRTSAYLHENAGFRTDGLAYRDVTVTRSGDDGLELNFAFLRQHLDTQVRIDDIEVAHTRRRQVVRATPSSRWSTDDPVAVEYVAATDVEVDALVRALARPRNFDGVLPALEGWCLQVDEASGHRRLMLHVSEMTYSSVMLRHYIGSRGAGRSYEQACADDDPPLLTLSLLPITRDGYVVIAQRSSHVGIGANRLAPGVNGNLELRARLGLQIDRNHHGMPDVAAAFARESREEIGLDLPHRGVEVVGLARIRYEQEVNTHVLLALCPLDLSRDDVVAAARSADLTEGYWELEGDFLFIPVPRDVQSAQTLVRAAFRSTNAVPHLAANIVAMCAPLLHTAGSDSADMHTQLHHLMQTREEGPFLEDLGHIARR